MPWNAHGGQRATLWRWFSLSTLVWILGIQLRLSALHTKYLFNLWVISLALVLFFLHYMYTSPRAKEMR